MCLIAVWRTDVIFGNRNPAGTFGRLIRNALKPMLRLFDPLEFTATVSAKQAKCGVRGAR